MTEKVDQARGRVLHASLVVTHHDPVDLQAERARLLRLSGKPARHGTYPVFDVVEIDDIQSIEIPPIYTTELSELPPCPPSLKGAARRGKHHTAEESAWLKQAVLACREKDGARSAPRIRRTLEIVFGVCVAQSTIERILFP